METIQIKAPQNPDDDSFTWTRCIETPSPTAKSTFFYVQEAGMLKMSAEQVSERQNMPSVLRRPPQANICNIHRIWL